MKFTRNNVIIGVMTLIGLIAASLILTNQTAQAGPVFATTRANAGYARAHAFDHITHKAVVKDKDPITGRVLSTKIYHGKAALRIARGSGTGGTPSSMGRKKVTITSTGRSILGFRLWHTWVWLDWNWYRPDHDTTMNGHGRGFNIDDPIWAWDGWLGESHRYFAWEKGWPVSGYHKSAQGSVHGPCQTPATTCHRYPKDVEEGHDNGTDKWSN